MFFDFALPSRAETGQLHHASWQNRSAGYIASALSPGTAEGAMIIVGLNAYHADAAACLMRDGKLIAAAEEERFRRIKHWAGFPSQALACCLAEAKLTLADVTHIAINRSNRANLRRKLAYVIRQRPSPAAIVDRLRNRAKWAGAAAELEHAFPGQTFRGGIEQVEHHYAHLASAYYCSSYQDAVAVSIDGFGDFASAAWGMGKGNALSLDGRILFPHSLGIFYQALTQYLGFANYGDEYKVMGLAAFGRASAELPKICQLLRSEPDGTYRLDLRYFRHHREDIAYEWQGGVPTVGALFSAQLEDLLGPARQPEQELTERHRNVAFATQAVFEDALFHLLNALHHRYQCDAIALAGGCAYNSLANGKISDRTRFRRSYLQAAAGDAGGAIGAAYSIWYREAGGRGDAMDHAYWGPQFTDDEIRAVLDDRSAALAQHAVEVIRFDAAAALVKKAAGLLANGMVVGWFQGRMEWGPRALGNRSILADPRRDDMKDILNLKIKRRESFRPFAPSILRESVGDWFEQDDDVPFMLKVFSIRPEKRAHIPAVTHVDGTGRLHTVERAANPRYYDLIRAFRDLTGVPMVLNTSFNENEPVVCRPEEALDCFLRTRMDALFLGDFMLLRDQSGTSAAATDIKS
jgi:carbamoyltransferase